jgi:hypothetical protein
MEHAGVEGSNKESRWVLHLFYSPSIRSAQQEHNAPSLEISRIEYFYKMALPPISQLSSSFSPVHVIMSEASQGRIPDWINRRVS